MTSVSHEHQVQPSQSYHNLQPEYDYAPAAYQYHPQHPQVMHSPTPQQTQQYYQQNTQYLQDPYRNHREQYHQQQYSGHSSSGHGGYSGYGGQGRAY